jgi:copper homeostasis protein
MALMKLPAEPLLEVIVQSAEEAKEAERGGADRLELVRELSLGGLTPSLETVTKVLRSVSIPVRVMLRENPSMMAGSPREVATLRRSASVLSRLPIDGLVMGFLGVDGRLAVSTMQEIVAEAPRIAVTFHRAFDEFADPLSALEEIKKVPQIDRVLTAGGAGTYEERLDRIVRWDRESGLVMLFAAGLQFLDLAQTGESPPDLSKAREIHVGRAARRPHENNGRVTAEQVRCVKELLSRRQLQPN